MNRIRLTALALAALALGCATARDHRPPGPAWELPPVAFAPASCPTGAVRMAVAEAQLVGPAWRRLPDPVLHGTEAALSRDAVALFRARRCRDGRLLTPLERETSHVRNDLRIHYLWTIAARLDVQRHPSAPAYWLVTLGLRLGVDDLSGRSELLPGIVIPGRWAREVAVSRAVGPGVGEPPPAPLLWAVGALYEQAWRRAEAQLPPSLPWAIDDERSPDQAAARSGDRYARRPPPVPAPPPPVEATPTPPVAGSQAASPESPRAVWERTRSTGPLACAASVEASANVIRMELTKREIHADYALGQGIIMVKLPLALSEQLQYAAGQRSQSLQVGLDLAFFRWFLEAVGLGPLEAPCVLQYLAQLVGAGDARTLRIYLDAFVAQLPPP